MSCSNSQIATPRRKKNTSRNSEWASVEERGSHQTRYCCFYYSFSHREYDGILVFVPLQSKPLCSHPHTFRECVSAWICVSRRFYTNTLNLKRIYYYSWRCALAHSDLHTRAMNMHEIVSRHRWQSLKTNRTSKCVQSPMIDARFFIFQTHFSLCAVAQF